MKHKRPNKTNQDPLVKGLRWIAFTSTVFSTCCLILAHRGNSYGLPSNPSAEPPASPMRVDEDVAGALGPNSEAPDRITELSTPRQLPVPPAPDSEGAIQTSAASNAARVGFEKVSFLDKIRGWAEASPSEAAAWANAISDGEQRRDALEQVALAWAAVDLPGSVAWFKALADDASKLTVGLALAYEIARDEPLTAVDLLARMPEHNERDQALEHSVSQWALSDLAAASQWAMELENGPLRSKALAAIAIAAADSNGYLAAELAARWLEVGDEQNRAAIAIVQRWGQGSPDDAAAWIAGFPTSALRELATQTLEALATASATLPAGEGGS